jgi:hypothetical protein
MKTLILVAMLFSLNAFSEVVLYPGQRTQVGGQTVYCSGNDVRDINSAVDVACVQDHADRARWTPDLAQIIRWVDDCRNPIPAGGYCTLLSRSNNKECYDLAKKLDRWSWDEQTSDMMTQKCRNLSYACRIQ